MDETEYTALRETALHELADKCAEQFQTALTNGQLVSLNLKHDLENQHARFKIWHSTFGILATSAQDAPSFEKEAIEAFHSMLSMLSHKVSTLSEDKGPILEALEEEGSSIASLILGSDSEWEGQDDNAESASDQHPSLA